MTVTTLLPVLVCGMTLMAGCVSTPLPSGSSSAQDRPPASNRTTVRSATLDNDMAELGLKKGMTATELRRAWGAPRTTTPMAAANVKAEVWTYHRIKDLGVRTVPTSMRAIPYQDPLTGTERLIQEPVYRQETISQVDVIELLLVEDRLVEWKRTRQHTSRFD